MKPTAKQLLRKVIKEEVRKALKESNTESRVKSVMAKHEKALLKALTARRRFPEDEIAHDDVAAELEAIADELGLDSSIPFMEDEMFSGSEKPKDAYQYAVEMFIDMVEDEA